jgi:small subunit ribosomal protein S13
LADKEAKEHKEPKEAKAPKDAKEHKEPKAAKESKEGAAPEAKPEKKEKGEKKPKEGKEKAEKAHTTAPTVKHKEKDDFKYIVRIVNSDLDGEKRTLIAIQGVKGVGPRVADVIIKKANVSRTEKIGNLSDAKIEEMENLIKAYSEYAPSWAMNKQHDIETGEDHHIVGVDLDVAIKDDINRMKMVKTYRGVRHETGQKVRGQRTRSNGRTGLTLGVLRQKLAQGAKPEGDKEKK